MTSGIFCTCKEIGCGFRPVVSKDVVTVGEVLSDAVEGVRLMAAEMSVN